LEAPTLGFLDEVSSQVHISIDKVALKRKSVTESP
jgi:hypothetical protein